MSRSDFKKFYNISDKKIEIYDEYLDCLKEWQLNKSNLVSRNSITQIWKRHFIDSMQIQDIVKNKTKKWLDFGSGAGFPGLVLNLYGYENMTLVEENKNKVAFLNHVINITGSKAKVIKGKIRNEKV